jgi:hypothetical protein
VLEVGSGPKFQLLSHLYIIRPSSGSIKELGSASMFHVVMLENTLKINFLNKKYPTSCPIYDDLNIK